MKADDKVSGAVLIALAVAICIASLQLHVGTVSDPSSGFFPILIGIAIGVLSLMIFLAAVFSKKEPDQSYESLRQVLCRKRVWYIILALTTYALVLDIIGFRLTTFLIFTFLLRTIEPQKWPVCIVGGLIASLGSYGLFHSVLGVTLPQGFFAP